ncbi:EF-hand domain-containing protein [Cochlodiniinecator piscidefendens]|uniref:EF-hand domain-containing protein n=1 Tax=Cochlodiniinecator piscidefendens TaxID=2715756 RepID=UPI00140BC5E5|nr:EF-hand domain-containing protein [Cochlodiniinecator piscidefendens]
MKHTYWISGVVAAAITASSLGYVTIAQARAGGHHGPQMTFEELDVDANGEITQEEFAAHRAARFAGADTDGDGFLTVEELTEAMSSRRERRIERMINRMDANDDGKLSVEEMTAPSERGERMFARIDADENGTVSEAEFSAMQEHMQNRRGNHRHGEAEASE